MLYLHLVCGPYRFVVETSTVLEAWHEGPDSGRKASTERAKRVMRMHVSGMGGRALCLRERENKGHRVHPMTLGRSLPVLDLRAALGGRLPDPDARCVQLVAAADGTPAAILVVDAVEGLVDVAATDFASLPPMLAGAARFFDAVLLRPINGWSVLRLAPLDVLRVCPENTP